MTGAAGIQMGTGHVSAGNISSSVRIDFSKFLPQIGELHQHYAKIDGMTHIEQRFVELERLMQSGASQPAQKSRIRELASDLGSLFQAFRR